jgi:hypothetical protein
MLSACADLFSGEACATRPAAGQRPKAGVHRQPVLSAVDVDLIAQEIDRLPEHQKLAENRSGTLIDRSAGRGLSLVENPSERKSHP